MTKIVKVLDNGGIDQEVEIEANGNRKVVKEIEMPRMVLERHGVDAAELVAADPERFQILDDDDDSPVDHDIQGNLTATKKAKAKNGKGKRGKTANAETE